jgi:membrane protease YdiL (CAAX protease family)
MLPQVPLERALWVGFALSAAICEEMVYRGYLFRQFRVLTGSTLAAVLLQAAAYGSAHLVLPIGMVLSVALLGVLLGALAVWQKSLIPGMILHTGTGLLAIVASGQ